LPLLFQPAIEKENHKDEVFLHDRPLDIIKEGKFNKVPLIIGVTSKEGLFIMPGKVLI
jgi:cholinesterase